MSDIEYSVITSDVLKSFDCILTLYSIITPLKYHAFENFMENGAFALLEQMLHFTYFFQKYSKLNFKFFFNFFNVV